MKLIIQKYGGSSLATSSHIRRAAERISRLHSAGTSVVVVVSAMGRMTDHLIRLAYRTVSSPPQRELDMLMTAGERISMSLLAMALEELGVRAISFTGSQSGIVTTDDHTDAKIIDIRAFRIQEQLALGKVVIVAGFQGVSLKKEVTTLGRGGSDTTAVALASVLGAERCEILTDVDGLFTADPKLVPGARLIPSCSYDQALELSSLGAKMHSRSIALAKRYQVKVRILSSRGDSGKFTDVNSFPVGTNPEGVKMEQLKINGVATQDGFVYFRAKGNLGALCEIFAFLRLPLRHFSFSDNEVSFLVNLSRAEAVRAELDRREIQNEFLSGVATIALVGEGLDCSTEFFPALWQTLKELKSPPLLLSVTSLSVVLAVPRDKKQEVALALHEKFLRERSIAEASEEGKKKEPPVKEAPKVGGETHLNI